MNQAQITRETAEPAHRVVIESEGRGDYRVGYFGPAGDEISVATSHREARQIAASYVKRYGATVEDHVARRAAGR